MVRFFLSSIPLPILYLPLGMAAPRSFRRSPTHSHSQMPSLPHPPLRSFRFHQLSPETDIAHLTDPTPPRPGSRHLHRHVRLRHVVFVYAASSGRRASMHHPLAGGGSGERGKEGGRIGNGEGRGEEEQGRIVQARWCEVRGGARGEVRSFSFLAFTCCFFALMLALFSWEELRLRPAHIGYGRPCPCPSPPACGD